MITQLEFRVLPIPNNNLDAAGVAGDYFAGDKVRTLTPNSSTGDQTRLPGALARQALPKLSYFIIPLPTNLTRAAGGFAASQEPVCFSGKIQRSIQTGNPICSCWGHTQLNTRDTFRIFCVRKNIFSLSLRSDLALSDARTTCSFCTLTKDLDDFHLL